VAQSSTTVLETDPKHISATPDVRDCLGGRRSEWIKSDRHDRAIVLAVFLYLALAGGLMLAHDRQLSPDQFFLLALAGMFFMGRAAAFLWDWLPPILLLLGYDSLRGVVPRLIHRVHSMPMIRFDRWLFGEVPTVLLQNRFFSLAETHWYDIAAVVLYFLHFLVPLLVALMFWFIDRPLFKRFMAAMVIVSYLAFVTYYLFPAMPPWMASDHGLLPPITPIMTVVTALFAQPTTLPSIYNHLGVNPVAAVPSLHAAYPLMMALFLAKKFPRWGLLAFFYPVAMWLSIVYLGEHYVFDIVVAVGYTLVVYFAMANWRRIGARSN
jgi:hypothetical protein